MALPTCDCIKEQTPNEVQQSIYCILAAILVASGGDVGSDEYTSNPSVATASGSFPVGALGWSITALTGTVTIGGTTLPAGATITGGGYGGRTLKTAVAYTIAAASSAAINYDTPS